MANITFDPGALLISYEQWGQEQVRRNKSPQSTARKIMRFWISFTMAKMRPAEVRNIEADMMRLTPAGERAYANAAASTNGPRRQLALRQRYAGTYAAYLVSRLNWKNARTAQYKRGGGSRFYGIVGQFIGARKWSRGIHKAGFLPVINALKPRVDGYIPKVPKGNRGRYFETVSDWMAELVAINGAGSRTRPGGNWGEGPGAVFPNALAESEREVARLIDEWLFEDTLAAARRAGFQTT